MRRKRREEIDNGPNNLVEGQQRDSLVMTKASGTITCEFILHDYMTITSTMV